MMTMSQAGARCWATVRSRARRLVAGQAGQLLPLTVILSTFGMTVTTALVVYVQGNLGATEKTREREVAYYTATAGIEAVLADAAQGRDLLSPAYTSPSVTVNDQTPAITIAAPPATGWPTLLYRYIDIGAATGLVSLAPGITWSVEVSGVQPFSNTLINVAFTSTSPPAATLSIVDDLENVISSSTLIETLDAAQSLYQVWLDTRLGVASTYTVLFENGGADPITAAAYSSIGGASATWFLTRATGKEYIITSTSPAGFQLRVYVRQTPGPGVNGTQVQQTVVVETWTTLNLAGIDQ